jgi:AbiV family abortive infection protein
VSSKPGGRPKGVKVPRPSLPALTPKQVVDLSDALLTNADSLLNSAALLLEQGQVALARSLAILGLEESGKAILLHARRVSIAYAPEGDPFFNDTLSTSWSSHARKLEAVYEFLRDEPYWFGVEPTHPPEDLALKTIGEWSDETNRHKQGGFYVDVEPNGELRTPQEGAEQDAVASVLERVHQIGWQLRLGEHIEASKQADYARAVEPATEEEIRDTESLMTEAGLDPQMISEMVEGMREGMPGHELHNAAYRHLLPGPEANPFSNVGRPGYEAQDRELSRLWRETHGPDVGSTSEDV